MKIEIRPISTASEYVAVEQLQREVWGAPEVEIIPNHVLMTVQKNGGTVLGAFAIVEDLEHLVGFVFGFAGITPDGGVKHCSHVAAVTPQYQNQNIGHLLKLAQRQHALAQGIDLITWTFDPLESRNARFNFHKLGAICNRYSRNHYGEMRDELNAGLPSDRFEVDWQISTQRVKAHLEKAIPAALPSALEAVGVPLVNRAVSGDLQRPAEETLPIAGERLLIQIPSHFQHVKATDRALALAWRMHTRGLFEDAFARGYTASDLLVENGQSFYLLESKIKRQKAFDFGF